MLGWRSVLITVAAMVGGPIVGAIIGGVAGTDRLFGSLYPVAGAVVGALAVGVSVMLLAVILWVPSLWREHRRIALGAAGVAVIAAVLATTLVIWDRTPRPPSLEAVVIKLEGGQGASVSPRDSRCPTYELSIRGNGNVTYVGHINGPVRGRQTARISQAEVARLVEAFYESGFFTMSDTSCFLLFTCGVLVDIDTTISFDGFIRKVHTGRSAPDGLFRLQDKIAAVAVANGWLTRAR
jgi:hypothetical protein